MKKLIFFICFFGLLFQIKAQENWLCVYPDKKVYFEDNNKSVYCIRIDSTFNGDSILYPFSDLHQIDGYCYSITDGSWLSKYVALNEDGNTIFVNGQNQNILIKNKAALNEVWDVFENENIKIKGEIISVELTSVLGVMDSVKTISFSVFNHADVPVNHLLNSLNIEVSKSFGLVKTLNFYYFEHASNSYFYHFGEFNLIGINEPQLGFQNINLREQYFDFQVGDELHILETSYFYPHFSENKIINRYISRTDYADSIVYYYEQKMNITKKDGAVVTDNSFLIDIVRQTIVKGLFFNTEPNEPIDNHFLYKTTIINNSIPTMYYTDFELGRVSDYCFANNSFSDGCYFLSKFYYVGLGGAYLGCCNGWGSTYCYNLVYYKKGDTEVGTPLELSVSENKEDNFNIFVNNNNINILLTIDKDIEISIYSISGLPLFNKRFTEQNITIPVSFPKGIYLIKIISNNKTYINKIVL